MKKFNLFAMVAVVVIVFSACQKDELEINESQNADKFEEKKDIIGRNGVLIFPNNESLDRTLKAISSMDEEERRVWEGKYSFTSQLSIFNDIVFAESKLDEPYENMSEEELKNTPPPPLHSKTYYTYLSEGVIKEFKLNDGTEIYDYSTCAPCLAAILNAEGIYAVGDTMYQFTQMERKEWVNCDFDNKEKLINTHVDSDEIKVDMKLKSTTVKYGDFRYDSGGKRRIRIGVNFSSSLYFESGKIWKYTHWIEVQSQKKNFWGNWKYNWTDMYYKGQWDFSVDYSLDNLYFFTAQGTAQTESYPDNEHIHASNLKATYDISTGEVIPYGSTMWMMYDGTFTKSAFEEDLYYIRDVKLTDFSWEVIGHAYVKATVNK
jgi:hypothetical protein